jgi:tetratricopeptide (TPR) repeat protein
LDAWESYQRGLWSVYQFTAEDNVQAQALFRRAIKLDANFASGHAGLAYTLAIGVILRFEAQPVQALDTALGEARLALRLDEQDSFALMALGRVLGLRGDFGQAIQALEKAVTISPSSSQAHYSLGFALTQNGDHERAIEYYDKAIRLSPRDVNLWGMENMFAHSLSVLGRNDEALVYARRSVSHTNAQFWAYAHLASILGHLDRIEEAGSALENLYKAWPDFDPQNSFPWSARSDKHFQDGLHKAGSDIPDEPAMTE